MSAERELLQRLVELNDKHIGALSFCGAVQKIIEQASVLLTQPEHDLPQWTDTPPTVPGWYWYRLQRTDEPYIIEGSLADGRMEWYSGDALMYAEVRGQWCGPIEPPRE